MSADRRRVLSLWLGAAAALAFTVAEARIRSRGGRTSAPAPSPEPPPPPPPAGNGPVPFSPTGLRTSGTLVGEATLAWDQPTLFVDITSIGGDTSSVVYRSQTAGQAKLGGTGVTAANVAAGTYSLNMTSLAAGTWYFAVASVYGGVESAVSQEISRTVT